MIYDAPDWCPPFGIVRPALPPDDAAQDAQCALAAAVEHAYLDLQLVDVCPTASSIPDRFTARSGRSLDVAPASAAGEVASSVSTPGANPTPVPGVLAQPRPVRELPAGAWTMFSGARL